MILSMARRLAFGVILALALAAAPAFADVASRKDAVDAKLGQVRDKIAAAEAREGELSSEIAGLTDQIRGLEGQVGDVSTRLEVLEHDLALHREKLDRLTELFRLQTQRYTFLKRQYAAALERLNRRIVEIYQSEDVGTLDVILSAASFTDLLERLDYVNQIGSQDKVIAGDVGEAKIQIRAARSRTRKTRRVVASATRVIAVRTTQVRTLRDQLVAEQNQLASARSGKRQSLASLNETERAYASEAEELSRVSSQLAAQIQAAQAAPTRAPASRASSSSSGSVDVVPSSSGLIWPVAGPVTSGFGWRWGRMHEGVDIAAPAGTPVRAAASGIVIYAAWMGGYGNLVIVDHGGGLATAYAHLSGYALSSGSSVGQGQTVGYVGCTGHCFGDHVHFEVRVNGSAVDPMGYL